MKVDISPERQAWLERELAASEWHSPAELVEAALHAYERHLADLRHDIAEADRAIQAGNGISETGAEFLARMRAKHPGAA
jgi:Arc/MetJ-type ribon-helix-helix transcriptional regulator